MSLYRSMIHAIMVTTMASIGFSGLAIAGATNTEQTLSGHLNIKPINDLTGSLQHLAGALESTTGAIKETLKILGDPKPLFGDSVSNKTASKAIEQTEPES